MKRCVVEGKKLVLMSNTFLLRGKIGVEHVSNRECTSTEYFFDWPFLEPGKKRCFCESLNCEQIQSKNVEILLGEKKRGWMEVRDFVLFTLIVSKPFIREFSMGLAERFMLAKR